MLTSHSSVCESFHSCDKCTFKDVKWTLTLHGQTLFFLKSECADIFHQSFLWLLRHTDEPQRGRNSCPWLQSRSVLSSFGVVLMSCRVNFSRSTISIAVFRLQNLIWYFLRAKVSSKWRVSRSSGTQKTCPFPWIAGYHFNRGNRYNDYANIFLQPHLGILFSLNGAVSLE